MKLRNKKTGEIKDLECITVFDRPGKNDIGDAEDEFYTIAELNEKWEDYKPKEPLIKDEKISKAVRAWAEACAVERCHYDGDGDFATRWHGIKLDGSQIELDEGHYTITELCGEEEE